MLALGHHFEQQIVHLGMGAPFRDQSHGNKSYIFSLGHNFETKATASNRTSFHWSTTSRPKQRQPFVNLSIVAPLRDQSILEMRNRFEAKATATNRTSWHWGTTSRPKQRQQIVHLSIGAPLRGQSNGNKSQISALGHHFEAKATATNRTS